MMVAKTPPKWGRLDETDPRRPPLCEIRHPNAIFPESVGCGGLPAHIAKKSCEVPEKMGPSIQWVETRHHDKLYALHRAREEACESTQAGRISANSISAVKDDRSDHGE